ncbi:hypothetical protein DLAC_06608 [Tieghemostelium lacteum]|uniref:Uncharacterized protein n=1 Tax=Tieghemostelium lacteum TaxID=361077 RepID=A0A151ZF71_TIELA|nr:hypothetical protein DLAC_06608 [Tieghemostelium lacteum]|eukprot:KYQ92613.1 hypothetical protein DLAC_06608 [Tieghemostelium lacteum]
MSTILVIPKNEICHQLIYQYNNVKSDMDRISNVLSHLDLKNKLNMKATRIEIQEFLKILERLEVELPRNLDMESNKDLMVQHKKDFIEDVSLRIIESKRMLDFVQNEIEIQYKEEPIYKHLKLSTYLSSQSYNSNPLYRYRTKGNSNRKHKYVKKYHRQDNSYNLHQRDNYSYTSPMYSNEYHRQFIFHPYATSGCTNCGYCSLKQESVTVHQTFINIQSIPFFLPNPMPLPLPDFYKNNNSYFFKPYKYCNN